MTSLTQLKIVIASPNDVREEREALDREIQRVNLLIAEGLGLTLKALRWETNTYPGFHVDGPQGLVDSILNIEDCDIFIGILWKRFGTPIKEDGETGTVHEFYKAYEAWKKNKKPQIMLYFNQKEYCLKTSAEAEQLLALLKFKESLPKEGLYREYFGLPEFEKVFDHLSLYLQHKFKEPNSKNLVDHASVDSQEHFQDLKASVVLPLVEIVKSEEKLSSFLLDHESSVFGINNDLFTDFFDNHYPQLKPKWDDIINTHQEIKSLSSKISSMIDSIVISELNSYGIKHAEAENGLSRTSFFVSVKSSFRLLTEAISSFNECVNINSSFVSASAVPSSLLS
ncbi:MAG: hypothetical protein WA667_25145 [Candidatus Nitrosopolaris sp.]